MKLLQRIKIHKTVYGIWSLFILYLLITMRGNFFSALFKQGGTVRWIELSLILVIFLEYQLLITVFKRMDESGKRILLFMIAFILRLCTLFFSRYTPTNDFANYLNGACYFTENGFPGGLYESLDSYGIPEFAGLAIINGSLLNIFSPTLFGMQILNSVYTSGICVFIYELGKKLDIRAGVAAAAFYTFYLAGLLSVQITTNTHGAAFFLLLSIILFDHAKNCEIVKKRFCWAVLCVVCLAISNYYHPSALIGVCAYIVYIIGCTFSDALRSERVKKSAMTIYERTVRSNVVLVIFIVVVYFVLSTVPLTWLRNSGFIKYPEKNIVLVKTLLAFNIDTYGGYSQEDMDIVSAYPQEEQDAVCIRMIQERIREPRKVMKLFLDKTKLAWFGGDNYFYFYMDGANAWYQKQYEQLQDEQMLLQKQEEQMFASGILSQISIVNDMFVYGIWGLAFIGLLAVLRNCQEGHIVYCMMYLPLGWMLFIMISEMQSRYRYQGFLIVVLLAGYGMVSIRDIICAVIHLIPKYSNKEKPENS